MRIRRRFQNYCRSISNSQRERKEMTFFVTEEEQQQQNARTFLTSCERNTIQPTLYDL